MKKNLYRFVISGYVLMAGAYFAGARWMSGRGMEYRMWAELAARILLWCVPLLLTGALLWEGIKNFTCRGKKAAAGFLLGCFVLFIICGTLLTVYKMFMGAMTMKTETKMPDGNLVVTAANDYGASVSCFAEPVGILARREFLWDSRRYSESLSAIYDTEFTFSVHEELGAIYRSEDYPGLDVQVWGAGYRKEDYLRENLSYLATGQQLEKAGTRFFQGAARLKKCDMKEDGISEGQPGAYRTTALLVYGDRIEKAAERIALFIREELTKARRPDGKFLWENMEGKIPVILQISEKNMDFCSFFITFGKTPENFAVYDEEVTAEDIEMRLRKELAACREKTESAGADDLNEPDESASDMQDIYNQINDGYVAIYVSEFADSGEGRFSTDQDAKGNQETIVYEDRQVVRFLRYDRMSQNEKCLLYVYYEADKDEEGSYSPTEARILDMYAYVLDTGEVIASGKTSWSDVGSTEYREAAGE